MFKKWLISFMLLFSFILILDGCGGGSGDDGVAISDKTYNLKNIPLNSYYFQMPMSSSVDDHAYEYIVSTTVGDKEDGLIPVDFTGSFSNKTIGYNKIINSTSYINNTSNTLRTIDNTTGVECELEGTSEPIPTDAKIGDVGSESTMICTDGSILKKSWLLFQDGIDVVFLDTTYTYDAGDNLKFISSKYCTILEDGTVTKVKIVIFSMDINATLTGQNVTVPQK